MTARGARGPQHAKRLPSRHGPCAVASYPSRPSPPPLIVAPAKAGTQRLGGPATAKQRHWIPAFAGMTPGLRRTA